MAQPVVIQPAVPPAIVEIPSYGYSPDTYGGVYGDPTADPYYTPPYDPTVPDPAVPLDPAALAPEPAVNLVDLVSPIPVEASPPTEGVVATPPLDAAVSGDTVDTGTTTSDGGGLNWFMIIVVSVVAVLTIVFSTYLMVLYQHPEDHNQAWFPKIVVVFGMTIAIYTVLMFPLDVTNSQVCDLTLPLVDCSTTFPMDILWQVVYIANMVTVFVLVPFSVFYYEGDSEWNAGKKLLSATLWTLAIVIIVVVIIGIPYILAGFANYTVQIAISGVESVSKLAPGQLVPDQFSSCIRVLDRPDLGVNACQASDAFSGNIKVRVSLIIYAMSLIATVGWILFLLFGAIGMVALPLDWIRQFISRPRTTITNKQYVERAKDLAHRAKDIQYVANGLKKEKKERGRSRKWRKNYSALQNQVTVLEEDNEQLERVFPQGEDPAYSWAITVMMYWVKLFVGVLALAVSITWVLQIILYMLIDPPVTPFLNTAFIDANNVFPLFGTILFGIFVFYLQGTVLKGNFKFGLNIFIFRVHPIKKGATVMSSFLFNVALVLLATTATIQFAASAFALYASNTEILKIFGNTLTNIEGIKYIYTENIYIYCYLAVMLISLLVILLRGPDQWKKKKPEDFYNM